MQGLLSTLKYTVLMTDGSEQVAVDGAPLPPEKNCELLERGGVIFFPESPFKLSSSDRDFLLAQKQKDADYHKNIAYRPGEGRITGVKAMSSADAARLAGILKDYSDKTQCLLTGFLSPYARGWKVDFASFRPIEEKGRKMRLRARNDLLHVDSFPTRPIFGDRILRVFINLNPTQPRIWHTSDTFEKLSLAFKDRMPPPAKSPLAALEAIGPIRGIARALGLKASGSSPYDNWMMNFHNFLKENEHFQTTCRKNRWEFPPGSAWIVFTDMVSHAVLSGQYAMEQTFIISRQDLALPEKAPINILERLYSNGKLAGVG